MHRTLSRRGHCIALLAVAVGALATLAPSASRAADIDGASAPATASIRARAHAGAAADSNVYVNSRSEGDALWMAGLRLDGDLLPSDTLLLQLAYRFNAEKYNEQTALNHISHLADGSLGFRPLQPLYVTLRAGAEQVTFSDRPEYSFWGAFGRATGRFELGEATTLRLSYRLRTDEFPDNTLDNVSHTANFSYELAATDAVDLVLPVTYEHTFYSERFLLDSAGLPTDQKRTAQRTLIEPTVRMFWSYALRITLRGFGEINASDDSYAFPVAPETGTPDPGTDTWQSDLLSHYDSYRAGGGHADMRYELSDTLVASLWLGAGARQYPHRPALDLSGERVASSQSDAWATGGGSLSWRPGGAFELLLSYSGLRQWSNDALWDFVRHRATLTLAGWWSS